MHESGDFREPQVKPTQAFLSLGSNLGNRQQTIRRAIGALDADQLEIVKTSSLYETEPTDLEDQPWFMNAVVEVRTTLGPNDLLARCQKIERDFGRTKTTIRFGPRTLDIDILLYGDLVRTTEQLKIPHPRMAERRFVLIPLLEIAPNLADPRDGCPLADALSRLDEGKKVLRLAIIES